MKAMGTKMITRLSVVAITARAISLVASTAARMGAKPSRGFVPGAPDLAVEVVSPNDRASDVLAKVYDWLDAGCRAVWVVDPHTRTVTVYRSRQQIATLGAEDELTGDDVVPGFRMPVTETRDPVPKV